MPLLCWPRELRVWWYDGQSAGREGERRREGGTQKSEPRARLGISRQNSQGIVRRSECPENRLNFSRLITFLSGAASNAPQQRCSSSSSFSDTLKEEVSGPWLGLWV